MYGSDYYDEEGCCLTCPDATNGCLCYECKCTKCLHYELIEGKGHCSLTKNAMTWEDYEDLAEDTLHIATKKFGEQHKLLEAVFSNGDLTRRVFYFNVYDVPTKILFHYSKTKFYAYRTLLLKNVDSAIIKEVEQE